MSSAGRKGSSGTSEISKRKSGWIVSKEPNTRFLNVDLDVKSQSDLRLLLEAWGHEVVCYTADASVDATGFE